MAAFFFVLFAAFAWMGLINNIGVLSFGAAVNQSLMSWPSLLLGAGNTPTASDSAPPVGSDHRTTPE